jgi:SAM-dependent methyltransferase
MGGVSDLYGASYGNFATQLFAEIRREAFGEDIGQTSWLSAEEHDRFIAWLQLSEVSQLLDVACGSGGPTLRIARATGAAVVGVDLHDQAIAKARAQITTETARFEVHDAAQPLAFERASFDAVICVDAINHFADRPRVLAEWRRVLKPGGRLVFTDPIVVTGPLAAAEIAIRSSIGFFLFVPTGYDEQQLAAAGFTVDRVEDRTENMARMARTWFAARQARARDLRRIEGDATFEGQQRFLETSAQLAAERRLSRLALFATA